MSRGAENPLREDFWRIFWVPRLNPREVGRQEVTMDACRDDGDCGKTATVYSYELVVHQPQRIVTALKPIRIAAGNSFTNNNIARISLPSFEMAGALLSSEWLSQPPSERS